MIDTNSQEYHDHLFRVVYRDTDQMGVVYYANYYVYMEIGRVELMRSKGSSYRELEEKGVYIPVVHCHCDYKKPARYDDLLRIRSSISMLTRVRLQFQYEIYQHERDELLATGDTHHVFMATEDHRPMRIPAEVTEMLTKPVLRLVSGG